MWESEVISDGDRSTVVEDEHPDKALVSEHSGVEYDSVNTHSTQGRWKWLKSNINVLISHNMKSFIFSNIQTTWQALLF